MLRTGGRFTGPVYDNDGNELSGAGGATWGSITGTLSSQSDLQTALDAKITASSTDTLTNKNIANANNTYRAASTTVVGASELATAGETTTGTDAARTVTPDGLAGSDFGKRIVSIKVTEDGGDALTTGDGKFHFFCPTELVGMNLVDCSAGVSTVSSSGIPTFQLHNLTQTADILSTKLTIDASEKHSKDATTAVVIDGAQDDIQEGDEIRIDCDVAGTGTKGVQIDMVFQLP